MYESFVVRTALEYLLLYTLSGTNSIERRSNTMLHNVAVLCYNPINISIYTRQICVEGNVAIRNPSRQPGISIAHSTTAAAQCCQSNYSRSSLCLARF